MRVRGPGQVSWAQGRGRCRRQVTWHWLWAGDPDRCPGRRTGAGARLPHPGAHLPRQSSLASFAHGGRGRQRLVVVLPQKSRHSSAFCKGTAFPAPFVVSPSAQSMVPPTSIGFQATELPALPGGSRSFPGCRGVPGPLSFPCTKLRAGLSSPGGQIPRTQCACGERARGRGRSGLRCPLPEASVGISVFRCHQQGEQCWGDTLFTLSSRQVQPGVKHKDSSNTRGRHGLRLVWKVKEESGAAFDAP